MALPSCFPSDIHDSHYFITGLDSVTEQPVLSLFNCVAISGYADTQCTLCLRPLKIRERGCAVAPLGRAQYPLMRLGPFGRIMSLVVGKIEPCIMRERSAGVD